jgi:class 3 adenylate cyclase
MMSGRKLQATILFADIIGASEISNNCTVKQYAEIINQFHQGAYRCCQLLKIDQSGPRQVEFKINGDEVCLILHSKENESDSEYPQRDCEQAFLFAIAIKLWWRASDYNRTRLKEGLAPREIAIGIHQGWVYCSPSQNEKKFPLLKKTDFHSEGYAINLAKRIEGESRKGKASGIFLSGKVKYQAEQQNLPLKFDLREVSQIKGITNISQLYEITQIEKRNLSNSFYNFLKEILNTINFTSEEWDFFAQIYQQEPTDFWTKLQISLKQEIDEEEKKLKGQEVILDVDFDKIIRSEKTEFYLSEVEKNFWLGRYEEVINLLEMIITINPDDAYAYYNKGVILDKLKRYREEVECYNRAISLSSNCANAYYNRRVILDRLEREEIHL